MDKGGTLYFSDEENMIKLITSLLDEGYTVNINESMSTGEYTIEIIDNTINEEE